MSDSLSEIKRSLQHKITAQIKQKGAISFAQFMQMALYEPGLGYYSAGLHKLGSAGDFVTAPELGSLFARCHAVTFARVLTAVTRPTVVELGAGTGRFCVDVLQALDQLGVLPERYVVVEISGDLRAVQQQAVAQLPAHLARLVSWEAQPPATPFNGIVFANEVLDALPVEVFRWQDTQYQRLMLVDQGGQLTEVWHGFDHAMAAQLDQMDLQVESGHRGEFIPQLKPWLASITAGLQQGMVLLVDYGFGRRTLYHPQRRHGTVVCHRRHQANFNPYQDVGLQDITAFVDFTAVAEAMEAAGLTVQGYTTQADFLLATGIEQWLDPAAEFTAHYRLVTEMKQLVLPEEMGEKFKTMVGTRGLSVAIPGFQHNRFNDL
ncbi:class I SAM-dependent methyltransferase [Marinicella meishanensis]|uniref:class I SAM-dependent methyltransferase n=1 Tax=Marinicella meishanensis TaxID=2873263 RepID=UPI001CBDBB4A|nr:SAM-dependent methyltransferase [Marinicella sp. NBU2979]